MKYFSKDPNDMNNEGKRMSKLQEILIGIGLPIISYSVVTFCENIGYYNSGIFVGFLMLIGLIFFCVKLLRAKYKLAGTIMLVLLIPQILFILLWGACALII